MTSYTPNIPLPTDNLSTSQAQILGNFQQLQTSFSVNHVPLTTPENNGKHTYIQMPTLGPADTLPLTLNADDGNLYTNTTSTTGSKTELFYTPDNSNLVYQLTRTSTTFYPAFATNGNYAQTPPKPTQFGGWTFLPGGLLLQYGFETIAASGTIKYPRTFNSGAFNIQFSLNANVVTSVSNNVYTIGTPGNTSFNWAFSGTTSYNFFYWVAIGT